MEVLVKKPLEHSNRSAKKYFLYNGGKLFLTRQDIGYDCYNRWSPGCPNNTFYTSYLHAYFCRDRSRDNTTIGISGDPLGITYYHI
jgi:hypothetical protein